MGRSSSSNNLIEQATGVPWWLAVAIALAATFGAHELASLPMPSLDQPATLVASLSLSDPISQRLLITVAGVVQYLIPAAFVSLAVVSAGRQGATIAGERSSSPGHPAPVSHRELQDLVVLVFQRMGCTVVVLGGPAPDVDMEVLTDERKYLVQCQHWDADVVGMEVVQSLARLIAARAAAGGYIVATGTLSEEAIGLAEKHAITLVHTDALLQLGDDIDRSDFRLAA